MNESIQKLGVMCTTFVFLCTISNIADENAFGMIAFHDQIKEDGRLGLQ